jgi:tripartite-type tricarboxylate transporter receptor subunit TctC
MKYLSWASIFRLGAVQMCLGAIVVLCTSTFNRLMVVEAGLPDVLSASWSAFLAPAGTPAPAIARLHEVIVAALRTPETTQRLTAAGFTIDASTPQELGATISAELARWKQVVKDANIQMN